MPDKKYGYVTKSIVFDGKRHYVYGRSEREAVKKLRDLEKELYTNGQKLDGNTTVKKWSEEWIEVYVKPKDITAKSLAMYQQKLDNYILPAIGAMRLQDVRDTHLKKLLNKSNSSKSTAQKVKIVLQAMFKQARKSRLISYDPAEDLELPKAPAGKRHSITDYERKNILEVAEWHRGGLYVLLVFYCGLRPGECAALQWKDIDFKKRLIHVRKALESGSPENIKEPKTAAGFRDVPIPAPLMEKLHKPKGGDFQYILLQPLGKKRHTESSLNDLWNNFKRHLDIHMGAEVKRNQIIKHCYEVTPLLETKENWEALVPYSLRHTYGTDLQRAGVPINVAKYLMGHSDISVTGNIYTDTTPDVVASAAASIDKLHKSDVVKRVVNQEITDGETADTQAV